MLLTTLSICVLIIGMLIGNAARLAMLIRYFNEGAKAEMRDPRAEPQPLVAEPWKPYRTFR